MAFGISATGFNRPRLIDIKQIIEEAWLVAFGADTDLTPGSPDSQIIGTIADRLDELWQGEEDNYNSKYPDTAFGASLDNIGAISGIPRLGAIASKALGVKLFGTSGTLIPGTSSGGNTQLQVVGAPSSLFKLDADVTLGTGQNSIQKITFSGVPTTGQWTVSRNGGTTAPLAFNANAAAVQAAVRLSCPFSSGIVVTGDYTIGFTFTDAGPATGGLMQQPAFTTPTNTLFAGFVAVTTATTILQAGVDQGAGNFTAIATGPTIAPAGTLTVIATPVSGFTNSLNVLDAIVGRNIEDDNAYRARRSQELQVAGAGTVEAIRAKLLTVTGVTTAIVFENPNEIPDLAGRPPKSFECVVAGGLDQDIADEIWAVKPAGIETDGTVVVPVTDSQGLIHNIKFSRPTQLLIYIDLTLTIDSTFPASGVAGAKQALADAGNKLGIGKEVVVSPYLISALATIPGIQNVLLKIGTAPSPTSSNNIIVAINEIAVFDTSRINVTTVT